jgi:hypothetical protein
MARNTDCEDYGIWMQTEPLRGSGAWPAQVPHISRQISRSLPRRTRIRLSLARRVNTVACWLCDHGHTDAAVLVWRACGMWH